VSGGTFARLFVALELPAEVRGALRDWARGVPIGGAASKGGMRVLGPEAQHVTLCFLGHRAVEEIDLIGEALGEVEGFSVGTLTTGAPVWLPPRNPRVLAVEVSGGSWLGELQAAVAGAVAAVCDWEPETRRFRAHVTVARMRSGSAPRRRELPPTPSLSFELEAVTLFRSWLHRDGAEYEALVRVGVG
jgi:RNA 2',3'-cyclic 3'-phosphodiesterase